MSFVKELVMLERRVGSRVRKATLLSCTIAIVLAGYSATIRVQAQGAAPPTFNADVGPILFEKCATCPRPGAGGPMSLTSYAEVRPWARSIKARTTKREMPPWSADPRFGHFSNDISLSDQQIDTIAKWVDAGMPQGSGAVP